MAKGFAWASTGLLLRLPLDTRDMTSSGTLQDDETLRGLVATHTTPRQFGLLGEPRVNVLELNLALDALSQSKSEVSR